MSAPSASGEHPPPDATRVLARARVLAAIGHRGLIEQDPERARARAVLERIRAWIAGEGLEAELEDDERARLGADAGALGPQATIDCAWRFEGAAVLSWALSLAPLPPHDRVADVAALSAALAIGRPLPDALRAPRLRGGRQLDRMREQLFAIHWRLVEQRLRPGSIDLATFARTAWFGPLEIDPATLVGGDLGLGGAPIARAPADAIARASSIARERHQAINWLSGDDPLYSEVGTDT